MLIHLKINTAVLICFAFAFRLLFVNIGLLSASNPSQANGFSAKHSSIQKRRRQADTVVQSNVKDYAMMEACEEGSDAEDDLVKAHSSVILSVFHSLIKPVTFIFHANRPFDSIKCDLYPKKYLALSILRI